jgi:hypothetical protein
LTLLSLSLLSLSLSLSSLSLSSLSLPPITVVVAVAVAVVFVSPSLALSPSPSPSSSSSSRSFACLYTPNTRGGAPPRLRPALSCLRSPLRGRARSIERPKLRWSARRAISAC